MKIPAYIVLRVLTLILIAVGLSLISLSVLMLTSENSLLQYRALSFGIGIILLLIAFIGPIRVIFHGAQIPVEIKRTIAIQAFALPISGIAFIVAAIIDMSNYVAFAYIVIAGCAIYSAIFGFYALSKTLPATFYIDEMLSILKSTGITGNKKNSQADQAFQRWTNGGSEGLAVGKQAVDGTVVKLDGTEVLLSSFLSDKPLVLNFASYSCPHYRKRIAELQQVMRKWKPLGVEFLTIYTAEAHAENGWKLVDQYINDSEYTAEADFCFPYAKSIEDRKKMAEWLISKKNFEMSVVLDTIDDNLLKVYNSWPIRLYVINDGKIVFCGDQGPFGYNPSSLNPTLEKLMK
ncbi:redoxin domain-containing protein [Francisella sp. Scap27]|uniref:deiodinase-like protein n=1 Tax=Francisella sp. Scap27 TaxID=2589986 RepID=UPI0015BA0F9F|nr:deiodinase-like protein [Francisella sp. Scap27]QLE78500.1 redoxin domain-containing protein [Francisella sp. Scap27]